MKRVEWSVGEEKVRGRLHTSTPKPAQALPLVVMGHGLSSSSVEFYDFPEKIARAGYAVLTLDYRGHGASDGPRGYLSKERVEEDLLGGIEAMKKEYHIDTSRVALLGHSTGAPLLLHAAPRVPGLRAFIALAPVARLRYEMNAFEFGGYNLMRLLHLVFRRLRVPYKVRYERLYVSQTSIARARKDDFLQHSLPVADYRPLVQELDGEAAARHAPQPTLVCIAEFDQVVKKSSSRRVFEALPGPKKLVEVPKSGHSMCGDERSDFVAAHVKEWLNEHVKGAAA